MLQVIKAGIVAVKAAMSEQVLFKSDKGSGFYPLQKPSQQCGGSHLYFTCWRF